MRQIFLDYDRAYDLDPNDPAVDDLARRIVEATRQRYGAGDLPGSQIGSEVPALIQAAGTNRHLLGNRSTRSFATS